MTMEEVNERFPLTKYKQWRSTRAEEGLPTAGGITAPASRAASMKDEVGVERPEQLPAKSEADDAEASKEAAASPSSRTFDSKNEPEKKDFAAPLAKAQQADAATDPQSTNPPHKNSVADDEDEEDVDQIQPTLPAELLPNPGDTCAICLDTIEDDDDVRGLTCGHAFHASCVDPWLTSRRACCPLCKADYYVAKPRNEGSSENDEGSSNRGRVNMPAHPPFAFLGGSGSRVMPFGGGSRPTTDGTASPGGRTRMILPGRFMTIVHAENDRTGYGFPQVIREPRPEAETRSNGRWSRSRSRLDASRSGDNTNNNNNNNNDVNNSTSDPPEGQGEQNQGRVSTWRQRLRNIRMEAPAVPGISMPLRGGRSRTVAAGGNAESQQQQQEISPGQLEAGTSTAENNSPRQAS
jgi:Ring finger domain